jgi:hypothetical protein
MGAISGKLPIARAWEPETVTYQGALVVHDGTCWQAVRDTAQRPGGKDWVPVASAGRDGTDGLTPNPRGAYDASKTYQRLDIVTYEDASYIAQRDALGLPGVDAGWQLRAARGEPGDKGPPGPRGAKGERGPPAPSIYSWTVDAAKYRAVFFTTDGKPGPELNLRPIFEAYHRQVSG